MENVNIPLSADLTGLISSLKQGREAINNLGQEFKKTGQQAEQSFHGTTAGLKREKGLIEDLEHEILRLEQARDKANDIDGISRYNKKIAEAKIHLDEYRKAGVQASEKINKEVSKTDQLFSKLKSTLLATFSVYAIGNFIKASVLAYNEQVKGERRLLTALKGREDLQKSIIDQAKQLSKITLFDDDATVAAAARMATVLKTNKDRIQELLSLVQDFATAKEMDLSTAADLVAKSIDGSNNMLSRYGITLKGASNTSERAKSAIEELTKAVKGQAEAARDADGGIGGLSIAWNNFQKSFGKAISPITKEVLNTFTESLNIMTDEYLTFWQKLNALAPGGMGMIQAKVTSELERQTQESIKKQADYIKNLHDFSKAGAKDNEKLKQSYEELASSVSEYESGLKDRLAGGEDIKKIKFESDYKQYELNKLKLKQINDLIKAEQKEKEKQLTAYEQLQKGVSDLEEKLKNEVVTRGKNVEIIRLKLQMKKNELALYDNEIEKITQLTGGMERMFKVDYDWEAFHKDMAAGILTSQEDIDNALDEVIKNTQTSDLPGKNHQKN